VSGNAAALSTYTAAPPAACVEVTEGVDGETGIGDRYRMEAARAASCGEYSVEVTGGGTLDNERPRVRVRARSCDFMVSVCCCFAR
jgi:hypothetical protein